jgi:hypothetical protein
MQEHDTNPGHHGGYAGAGTILLQGGKRVAVDPETLAPLPTQEKTPQPQAAPEPAPEKTKPAAKPAGKAAPDLNPAE